MNNLQINSSEFKAGNHLFPVSQLTLFRCQGKAVEVSFSGERICSDGGALLLGEVENQIGLLGDIAGVIGDERDGRYINHELEDIHKQRVFQIACGNEDANDCTELRSDPVFKLCVNRLPETG